MWAQGDLFYILHHHLSPVLLILLPKLAQFWLLGQMLAPVSLCYVFMTSLFLTLWDAPSSANIFSTPALESATSPAVLFIRYLTVLETKIGVLGMLFAPGVQSQWTELRIMHMYTSRHIHITILLLYKSMNIYMKRSRSSCSCLQLKSIRVVHFIPLPLLIDNLSLPQREPDSRPCWPSTYFIVQF